jgi:hypothetical protein
MLRCSLCPMFRKPHFQMIDDSKRLHPGKSVGHLPVDLGDMSCRPKTWGIFSPNFYGCNLSS